MQGHPQSPWVKDRFNPNPPLSKLTSREGLTEEGLEAGRPLGPLVLLPEQRSFSRAPHLRDLLKVTSGPATWAVSAPLAPREV